MSLLHVKENFHWDLTGIEFALEERVREPENFVGRVEELEYLYQWAVGTTRISHKKRIFRQPLPSEILFLCEILVVPQRSLMSHE